MRMYMHMPLEAVNFYCKNTKQQCPGFDGPLADTKSKENLMKRIDVEFLKYQQSPYLESLHSIAQQQCQITQMPKQQRETRGQGIETISRHDEERPLELQHSTQYLCMIECIINKKMGQDPQLFKNINPDPRSSNIHHPTN